MVDELTEIPRDDWPALRDMYKIDWPNNIVGYYTIDNYIKWFEKEPNIKNIKIYTLNSDWSDGTYVIVERYQVLFNSLNKDYSRLIKGLSLLDYSRVFIYFGYVSKLKSAIDSFLKENSLNTRKILPDSATVWHYLPNAEALKFEVNSPNGITLQSLKEENADIVNELWPHHHEGSLYYIKRLIRLNLSLGAFTDSGELVAWCLRAQFGSLALLQVIESHKRQGLGSLMIKAMSKLLAENGCDICAPVVEQNIASKNMFAKLGFKIIDKVYWSFVETDRPFLWKDEYDN